MKILRKIAVFLFALFLFIIISIAGVLFFDFSGAFLFSFIIFIIFIGIMVNAIRSWVKRKHHWTTNVVRILLCVIGIAALYFSIVVNHSLESQIKLLTDSPLSPKLKINILSHNLVGHPVLAEEYATVKENGITFHYPTEEKNYDVLIDHVNSVIGEHHKVYESFFGDSEKQDLNITFSHFLQDQDRYELGFYKAEEKQIYLQIPFESMGWEAWENNLVHEYSHYLFDMAVQEKGLLVINFPQWFNEGIAAYIPKKPVVEENLKNKEWVPYNELAYEEVWNEKRLDARYAPYFQAYQFINKLVEWKGPEVIPNIIDKYAQNNTFEKAFLLEVGKTPDDFGDEVIQEIEQMTAEK